ncbi:hypothetical protein [Haloplasma contractile]|uniref:Uncharacterized protein n=1 Tax=Haloplasma contractile SSD-17B TaxID=1033810 RepID=U2E7K1_9MOLU|nr:hypothetical protein [Haloplasma contractile]ERJ10886.1 hypothetical protein HLPCO_003131 [Haloplasma contractile SSD-17B]
MRKYNKKILTALVVAYKKGIINKAPLRKWMDNRKVVTKAHKFLTLMGIFMFVFIMLNVYADKHYTLNYSVMLFGRAVNKFSLMSIPFAAGVIYQLYNLVLYLYHVYFVRKTFNKYKKVNFNLSQLDNITYKIQIK